MAMRTKEEIRADIEAEQAAQDAALKLIAHAYLRNYDNFIKWMGVLHTFSKHHESIYKALWFIGHLSHDAEPARLNFEKRRQVLDRLYKESRARREADKKAQTEVTADHD